MKGAGGNCGQVTVVMSSSLSLERLRSSWKRGPSLSKDSRGMISDSMGKKAVSVVAVLGMQWAMEVAKLAA